MHANSARQHKHLLSLVSALISSLSAVRAVASRRRNDADRAHLQVGASNELPESEELDALYDRFLIRRQVAQVRCNSFPADVSC